MQDIDFNKQHEGCTRCYIRNSKAYYAQYLKNEKLRLTVGFYDLEGGGTSGEFGFEWVELGQIKPFARLVSFEDSWSALWGFKDLLEIMSKIDDGNIQEPELCIILDSLGIKDITNYVEQD